MDAVSVEVNWSAVAARAFEEKLLEIASHGEKQEMSEFIRVLGPDPVNKNRKTYQHIHRAIICKAIPVYAEEKGGMFFDCTPNHPGAKLVSYRLLDANGVQYSCGDPQELNRLGIVNDDKKGRIGFVQVGGKKQECDLVEGED